jgi:hypothetical protein
MDILLGIDSRPGAVARTARRVGASTSGRGAAEADEMLAEGFGRD